MLRASCRVAAEATRFEPAPICLNLKIANHEVHANATVLYQDTAEAIRSDGHVMIISR